MTGMINFAGGLKKMGAAVAEFGGNAALAAQRDQLQRESMLLADELAGARESKGREETAKYRAAGDAQQHGFNMKEREFTAGRDDTRSATEHQQGLARIGAQGAESRKTDAAQHSRGANDVTDYKEDADGNIVGLTRSGKVVRPDVKAKKAVSAADKDLLDRIEGQFTSKVRDETSMDPNASVTKMNVEGVAGRLRDMGRTDLAKIYDPAGAFRKKYPSTGGDGEKAAPAATLPPAKDRVLNKVYSLPNGKFKWTEQGWEPQ